MGAIGFTSGDPRKLNRGGYGLGEVVAADGTGTLVPVPAGVDDEVLTTDPTEPTGVDWEPGGGGGGSVPPTRTISTLAPLAGGGDLSADRTLSVAVGSTAGTVAAGNDPRLSDARTPTPHAPTHAAAGSDPVTPGAIGAAPTSRIIATTAPLTGGGDLSADRTLGVSVGTGAGTVAAGNDSRITGALQRSGGTMTGDLVLAGDPDQALEAATKQYVDAQAGGGGPQTISFGVDGPVSTGPGSARWVNRTGGPLTVVGVWIALGSPAVTGSTVVDVNLGPTMSDPAESIFVSGDAPTFVAVGQAQGGAQTSINVSYPGVGQGAAAGQMALLIIDTVGVGAAVVSTPTDYFAAAGTPTVAGSRTGRMHVFYKPAITEADVGAVLALATEAAASVRWNVHLLLYSGGAWHNIAIDTPNTVGTTTSTPSFATAPANSRVVRAWGTVGDTSGEVISWTPATSTERSDLSTTSGLRNATSCVADLVQVAEGATGTENAASAGASGGSVQRTGMTIVLESSGSGPKPTIDAGSNGGVLVAAPPGTVVPDGGYLTFDVDQVGDSATDLTGGVVVV